MPGFREALVTDTTAHALLAEYFGSRELSFPQAQGRYQPVYPVADQFVPPRGVFLVVEGADLDGNAADVGCGGIRRLQTLHGDSAPDDPVRFEVKHLWLEPHTRGLGYGRALLRELERRAVALGAEQLVLDTNDSLTAAAGLYRSSGFAPIAPYNDNPNADLWLRKVL